MMKTQPHLNIADLLAKQNDILSWLENEPEESHVDHASTAFELLLSEAAQPKSVSGNACVRLCGFVDYCSKSQSAYLQNWAISHDVTQRLFTFYVEWNESDHHRSMKLVLDTIVQLRSRNLDKDAVASTDKILIRTLVSFVIGTSTKPVAKSAIKTLDHFITKKVFTLDHLSHTYASCLSRSDTDDPIELWRTFFAELFNWLRLHYVCQTAGKLMVTLYRGLREQGRSRQPELTVELWHQWLLSFLAQDPSLLERVRDCVFIPLFKVDRAAALEFLRKMNSHEVATSNNNRGFDLDVAALLQLAALETGKSVGLVEEPALDIDSQPAVEASSVILHEKILNSVLAHPAHEVRSLAFSLLITSPSTTRPYSSTALDLLRKHLSSYFADPDAKFRMDVMTKARDMFKRIRGAICVLKRSIPRARAKAEKRKIATKKPTQPLCYHSNLIALPEAQLVDCLSYHEAYLKWYIQFLCNELTPTASYQRHVASLKALSFILRMEGEKSKTWETTEDQQLFFDLFDETWVRVLYDLIMDPFDDVRHFASTNLKSILSDARYRRFSLKGSKCEGFSYEEAVKLYHKADDLARYSSRADHSDGAARAGQLLYKFSDETKRLEFLTFLVHRLEVKLGTAEGSLGRAVLKEPLHGDFATLRYIWQVMSDIKFGTSELEAVLALQDQLVDQCERIWYAVRDVLCDDSPEGHLPQDLRDFEGINTRDLLSYCFRSVHESSDFMRYMVLTIKNNKKEGYLCPSPKVFKLIGTLTFEQLSNLRHRGAFTTVSQTFATCCQQTKYLKPPDAEGLLDSWYQGAMREIFAQVSTTRRSAGIPALITGILSANSDHPSFEEVMEKLIEIASIEARVRETDDTSLPQVHAFNCLKDIFKNSFLTSMGNKSENYLPQCLELAANGLKSKVWAIRNCGLILLRSLIDCLFGSHESKSMIEAGWDGKANRIAYHRYTTLPNVLLSLLKSGHQMMGPTAIGSAGAESVFPALDIVRRAGPPDALRNELQVHIAAYLASPVWHVREMAARTLCSCLLHEGWLSALKSLLLKALNGQSFSAQNEVHGVLLVMKFVFDRLSEVAPERLNLDLPSLVSILKETKLDQRYPHCPDILATQLEVVNLVTAFQILKSSPVEQFHVQKSGIGGGSALLKIQQATYEIYAAFGHQDPINQLRGTLLGGSIGVNTMVAMLELLPKLWMLSSTTDSVLAELCALYVDFCLQISSDEAQAVALENLADVLDHLLNKGNFDLLQVLPLQQLWATLSSRTMGPSLSEAVLRISGCIVVILRHFDEISADGIRTWGLMMADAGLDDKGFDTRFAAAQSLQSFFTIADGAFTSAEYLPTLLALYDVLNDDDDEVRDIGSAASRRIANQALVPIEAANRLLQWLAQTFGDSVEFRSIVAVRIIGGNSLVASIADCQSADTQLDEALTVDNSLFAVEEQNLFIDEIRETKRWLAVFDTLSWSSNDGIYRDLTDWVSTGVTRLQRLMGIEWSRGRRDDGPLGWASNPQAFAISSRILLASMAMESKGLSTYSLGISRTCDLMNKHNEGEYPVSGLLAKPYLEGYRP